MKNMRMSESHKKRRKWMWCYLGGSPCPWYPWVLYSSICLSIAGSQSVTWKNFPPKFPNFNVVCCSTTPVWERVYCPIIQINISGRKWSWGTEDVFDRCQSIRFTRYIYHAPAGAWTELYQPCLRVPRYLSCFLITISQFGIGAL